MKGGKRNERTHFDFSPLPIQVIQSTIVFFFTFFKIDWKYLNECLSNESVTEETQFIILRKKERYRACFAHGLTRSSLIISESEKEKKRQASMLSFSFRIEKTNERHIASEMQLKPDFGWFVHMVVGLILQTYILQQLHSSP